MDSAYGSDKKPEPEIESPAGTSTRSPAGNLAGNSNFENLAANSNFAFPFPAFKKRYDDEMSLSSCSDLSSVSTVKRTDYDSVIRYDTVKKNYHTVKMTKVYIV